MACCWQFLCKLGKALPRGPARVRPEMSEGSMPEVGPEDSFLWGSSCGMLGACTEKCGRTTQEDAMDVYKTPVATVLAVYDGHGGVEAVAALKQLVRDHIRSLADLRQDIFDKIDGGIVAHLRSQGIVGRRAGNGLSSGAVACIAVVEGNQLGIANLGDCRAVIAEQTVDGEGDIVMKGTQLTEDHNVKNAAEKERVHNSGDLVDDAVGGHLEVTRAFGDVVKKSAKKLPGLSTAAQILPIMELHKGLEFLILMCDGVVDVCTPQAAARTVRASLRNPNKGGTAEAAVSQLVRGSCRRAQDNATAVVAVFNMPPPRPPAGVPPS
mmetsp:Transcript_34755/g.81130  ORF Transcript_34755/g.81130 Transcript_34755/m.81130 type:complete len:324 (+) Transcript_34755:90-1061(+)